MKLHVMKDIKRSGEYYKPLKLECRGTATHLKRAKAYVDKVEGLDEKGYRNTCLSSAMHNILDKFGVEAAKEVLPELLTKSTLPNKEKHKVRVGNYKQMDHKEGMYLQERTAERSTEI